jgi:tellurite resistance protein
MGTTQDPTLSHPLRYRGDLERATHLLRHPAVASAIEARARRGARDIRRDLLGNALRLSGSLAPEVTMVVERCRDALGVPMAVEVYVYPSPQFNAGCTAPDAERVYVILSSSLVDAFAGDELTFVVGHELGHHLFAHHAIPAGELLGDGSDALRDPGLALDLFAWQRCAEISADRAGLACTRTLTHAGRAMFKLTSGLAGSRVAIDLAEFLHQAADLARADVSQEGDELRRDWFTTHPFSPLRIRALQLAVDAPPFGTAMTAEAADAEIGALLAVMEPRYTIEHTEAAEAMRRLLFAAGIAIAAATGAVDPAERAALEQLLGAGSLPVEVDVAAVREVLNERMARVREVVPPLRRHQVLRDLCVIARADGRTSPLERAVLTSVATGIGLSPNDVTTALAQAGQPLD